LRREKAALETTFTAKHPKVQKVDAQLASLEKAFRNETQGVINRIRNDYEIALRQEKSLTSAYASQSQRVSAIGGKAAQFNALKREVETLRQMYQSLLMQANQTGMTNSVPVAPIRLVDPSSPARQPAQPVPAVNISFGAVAGLLLAGGIVFLRERLDSRVKSPGLSRVILNAPELGVIPSTGLDHQVKGLLGKLRKDETGHNGTGEIGFWEGRPSVLAESFRGTLASLLRTKDEFGRPPQVALVTSSGPGEGKTMISANLGIALAETGRRILLVDGDFRRPRLHQIFRMPNERSLMDLLQEDTPVAAYPVDALGMATPFEGLYLLPNRLGRGNITQALYSPRLPEVISRLREHYDMILIDSPPVLHLADARIVAKLVDGVILVIRAGKTDREVAVEAYQRICEDGLSLIGTVLNDWNPAGTSKHYYYYSYSQTDKQSEG
jgi:capsular exopolysaccharide synthesis family protein